MDDGRRARGEGAESAAAQNAAALVDAFAFGRVVFFGGVDGVEWSEDWQFYLAQNHTLLAPCLAHPDSPFRRWDRACYLGCMFCFTFFFAAYIEHSHPRSQGAGTYVGFVILSSLLSVLYDACLRQLGTCGCMRRGGSCYSACWCCAGACVEAGRHALYTCAALSLGLLVAGITLAATGDVVFGAFLATFLASKAAAFFLEVLQLAYSFRCARAAQKDAWGRLDARIPGYALGRDLPTPDFLRGFNPEDYPLGDARGRRGLLAKAAKHKWFAKAARFLGGDRSFRGRHNTRAQSCVFEHGGEVTVPTTACDDEADFDALLFGDVTPAQTSDAWRARPSFSLKKLAAFCGPGCAVALAYIGPAQLRAGLKDGAYDKDAANALLWTFCVSAFAQSLAAEVGIVSGVDLGTAVRREYSPTARRCIFVLVYVAGAGTNVQALLGAAAGMQALTGAPGWVGCAVANVATLATLAWTRRAGIRCLEGCLAVLAALLATGCVAAWALSPAVSFENPARTFVYGLALPSVARHFSTLVMPQSLFLHSTLVLTRNVRRDRPRRVDEALRYSMLECLFGLALALILNFAVLAAAAQFFSQDCDESHACLAFEAFCGGGDCDGAVGGFHDTCGRITLKTAAPAFKDSSGGDAQRLWGLALFASGLASTVLATLAAQHTCQQLAGDAKTPPLWTRLAALAPAGVAALILAHAPAEMEERVDAGLNLMQSALLPFALVPLAYVSSQSHVMGPRRAGGRGLALRCAAVAAVLGVNASLIARAAVGSAPKAPALAAYALLACLYVGAVALTLPPLSAALPGGRFLDVRRGSQLSSVDPSPLVDREEDVFS
ncbi:natural resistance-associated macrophage protein-domain-containing protein [Pelagophyceae sp. CCMP2097]|nr:natural resistance-associated macrophage protein-domain-containing protein [Pelagophyceae sp. CCMP2097]